MTIKRFFQNEKEDWVVYQHPNFLLSSWLITQVAQYFIKSPEVSTISQLMLFAWAYNELTKGESPFRRTLGGAVILYIIVTVFIQWPK